MRRPHLFTTAEPWKHWGIQLKAMCGREIPEAVWLAGVDTYSEMSIESPQLCEKCRKARMKKWADSREPQLRWEYVITEGQEAINAEVSA